jgi:endonuclease/exonuclease/phosphatase family metal-dependent hydrolase
VEYSGVALRLATWNLWWRFGPWEERRPAIGHVLRETDPDICALQEVWAEDGRNLAGELAEELEMHWSWTASPQPERWRFRKAGETAGVGTAVLSRWPIVDGFDLTLPAAGSGDGGRTATVAVVKAPAGDIPIASVQLTSAPWDSAARCAQVRALVERLAALDVRDHPVVVAGDLNAEPDSDEVRLLCGHKTAPAREGFVLVDAWRYAPSDALGWTWDRANPHVLATMEPSSRIDYVLVGPPRSGRRGAVLSARRIGAEPVEGVWPSDHAGVLAELESG